MTPEVKERIDQMLQENKVLVFMKGSKLMPQCGFSNNVVQIFNVLGIPFETFDVLQDYDIRQGIKEYSNWPTIPQVYINGEFVGGSDIMIELYQSGELQEMVEVALAS
jgi:monothiol glutaredoxin